MKTTEEFFEEFYKEVRKQIEREGKADFTRANQIWEKYQNQGMTPTCPNCGQPMTLVCLSSCGT